MFNSFIQLFYILHCTSPNILIISPRNHNQINMINWALFYFMRIILYEETLRTSNFMHAHVHTDIILTDQLHSDRWILLVHACTSIFITKILGLKKLKWKKKKIQVFKWNLFIYHIQSQESIFRHVTVLYMWLIRTLLMCKRPDSTRPPALKKSLPTPPLLPTVQNYLDPPVKVSH